MQEDGSSYLAVISQEFMIYSKGVGSFFARYLKSVFLCAPSPQLPMVEARERCLGERSKIEKWFEVVFHGLLLFPLIDAMSQFVDVQSFIQVEIVDMKDLGILLLFCINAENVALTARETVLGLFTHQYYCYYYRSSMMRKQTTIMFLNVRKAQKFIFLRVFLGFIFVLQTQHMMSEPEYLDNSLKLDPAPQKRKRKFKIFDSKPTQPQTTPNPTTDANSQGEYALKGSLGRRRELRLVKAVQMVKLQPKDLLQKEFYGQVDGGEQQELQLLELPMDEYQTVRSNKFISTDGFKELPTPSLLLKNQRLVINEAGALYQSVQQVRNSHQGLQNHFEELRISVRRIDSSVRSIESASEVSWKHLQEMQSFLEAAQAERHAFDRKVNEVQRRISLIESALIRQRDEKELQVFDEEDGERVQVQDEDEDEFAESHYLPAEFITKYLQQRKSQQKIQQHQQLLKKNKQIQTNSIPHLNLFHPIFKIGKEECLSLITFLLEQLPTFSQDTISLRLLFRRGTTDLDSQSLGDKSELQYKSNLLFLVKTSTGKRIGGFISNFLVQQQSMEDEHAFLFTLQDHCHKFKIKPQCSNQAFSASKFYLICFSSDLMISSNCLQQENYCEWPSSYSGSGDRDNSWLAGDFEFMIQHIEVFAVQENGSGASG